MTTSDRSSNFKWQFEPCAKFFEFYLQTESGAIKRITLPMHHYNTTFYLHSVNEGRHASYLDCHARQRLKDNPNQTYAEALGEVFDGFREQPGFTEALLDRHEDDVQYEIDEADFWAVLDAREAAWRRVNNDHREKLPPLFD